MTYDMGGTYGQLHSRGSCSVWSQRFINNSNTEVIEITFDPPAGRFSTGTVGNENYREWAAGDPEPAVLDVSIPPHESQVVRFETCTSTPPPEGSSSFSAQAPESFDWLWVTGNGGRACFNLGC